MVRHHRRRLSRDSDSSASSPERDVDEDHLSIMTGEDDSQSSLGASMLEEMDLDSDSAAAQAAALAELEQQHRRSAISRLPAEILIAIFAKLPSPVDLQRCMLVSRSWARNAIELLWYKPSTNAWRPLHKVIRTLRSAPTTAFAYHHVIRRLNFSSLGDQVSDGALIPFADCKRVERLTLTNCSRLGDLSMTRLLQGNSSLLALDASGLECISDKTALTVARNCFRLQGLNLTACRKLTDASLVQLAMGCRRVKRLKLADCAQITDLTVVAFAEHCRDLLEVDLQRCRALTDLSITQLIKECRHMREIRLAGCARLTDDSFLKLPSELVYDNLRILDLTDCSEMNDQGIARIVHAAPRLRNLVLAKCRHLTDRGINAITRLGKNLHYIHLGHCNRITDYGVTQLIRCCQRIRYIDLACCINLTDESVKMLAGLTKLKRIGLVKCHNITDESIIALSKQNAERSTALSNSLERVHLSYCINLTTKGVAALLVNCLKLTHLSLTGVSDFLREDFLCYCRAPPPEFTEHQREVFCVFSNGGVDGLRTHFVNALIPRHEVPQHLRRLLHPEQSNDSSNNATTTPNATPGQPAQWPTNGAPPVPPRHASMQPLTPAGIFLHNWDAQHRPAPPLPHPQDASPPPLPHHAPQRPPAPYIPVIPPYNHLQYQQNQQQPQAQRFAHASLPQTFFHPPHPTPTSPPSSNTTTPTATPPAPRRSLTSLTTRLIPSRSRTSSASPARENANPPFSAGPSTQPPTASTVTTPPAATADQPSAQTMRLALMQTRPVGDVIYPRNTNHAHANASHRTPPHADIDTSDTLLDEDDDEDEDLGDSRDD